MKSGKIGARAARTAVFCLLTGAVFCVLAGCQSLNEDTNNKRCWFPSFVEPGYLNPDHERNMPEGSDPFPNANIGPKSLQARPQYWDCPREWNRDVTYAPPVEAAVQTSEAAK